MSLHISLYTFFDKILLGLMLSKESVAYYEYSDKIVYLPKAFITIISTVLFPKSCQYAAMHDYNGMHKNIDISITVSNLIGFAAFFGLIVSAQYSGV